MTSHRNGEHMKHIIGATLAALVITGCGAPNTEPTATPSPKTLTAAQHMDHTYVYMSEFLKDLRKYAQLVCDPYERLETDVFGTRETGQCEGMKVTLATVDYSDPKLSATRDALAFAGPFVFNERNWIIITYSEANAKEISRSLGIEPIAS